MATGGLRRSALMIRRTGRGIGSIRSSVKCDRCDNEATVHEVRIESGKRREKHLCEQCAKSEGVAPQVPAPITALLTQFMTQGNPAAGEGTAAGGTVAPKSVPCPVCGTTYAQFRQTGLLGCAKCYEVFETQLSPLIARAHEGGTRHLGKTPRPVQGGASGGRAHSSTPINKVPAAAPAPPSAPKADDRAAAQSIATLKQRLADAVAAEEYEKAAKLRDELVKLHGMMPGAGHQAAEGASKRKPRQSGEQGEP
jgi:protein arginine kinase activator